jgi:hypothetical protein
VRHEKYNVTPTIQDLQAALKSAHQSIQALQTILDVFIQK